MLLHDPEEHSAPQDSTAPIIPARAASAPSVRPWTFRDLLLFIGFAIVALLVANLGALAVYAALKPLFGWRSPPQALTQNTFFLLATQLVFYVMLFAYIYLLVVFHYRLRFWEGVKWGRLTGSRILRYVMGGILVTVAIQFFPAVLPDKSDFPLQRLFSSADSALAVAAFAVLIAPFMEELIFRGVLFSVFEIRVSVRFAIIATAILFAAMHVPEYWGAWDHVFLIFLVGLVFSWTRGLTRSLAPSVVLHVTYNACLMFGLFFATSHFRMIQNLRLR